ncbi:MAG: peptidoglycan recognition family protein [Elusimicrobiota bacterium]|nr:peptidoglycan recognition family protein [Elusimicrobiota bacterium]
MRRLFPLVALVLAAGALTGCEEKNSPAVSTGSYRPSAPPADGAPVRRLSGKNLMAYAPATDFVAAAPEDAAHGASAMFDGARTRGGVTLVGYTPASAPSGRGKRLPYTADASRRVTDLGGVVPPLPDDYDYSRGGATPGSAKDAGQTLLGFASFQIAQKFPTVAPIMSRMGWRAAPRRGSNSSHSLYRVTVHHTQGRQPMNEAETASAVKNIQHYHMVGRAREGKEAFDDIGYHFLIAGDGRVVEGRRAEYIGAHAGSSNEGNIGAAMMGDFNKVQPTAAQLESLTRLVTYLSIKYKKDPGQKGFLEAHNHYNNTDCPGRHLMSRLEALRRVIDQENEIIVGGGSIGDFTPLAVIKA